MHYNTINGLIYTASAKNTNKVEQIKADNIVYLDNMDNKYEARLLTGDENRDMLVVFADSMGDLSEKVRSYMKDDEAQLIELKKID